MPLREPSQRARSNWDALPDDDRQRVIEWAAHYLLKRELLSQLGSGVTGVGFGSRERDVPARARKGKRRRRRRELVAEPTLVVFVEKKVKAPRAVAALTPKALVPRWIQLRVPVGARRLQVAIPTDVSSRPPIPRAQSGTQKQGLYVTPGPESPGGGPLEGLACALVQRPTASGTSAPHLLSCHHLVLRTKTTPLVTPDPGAKPHTREREPLGAAGVGARFGVGVAGSVDAALIDLDAAGLAIAQSGSYWKRRALGTAQSWAHIQQLAALLPVELFACGGERIELDLRRVHVNQPVAYAGGTVEIFQVIEFESKGLRNTQSGDSGAPVFTGGTLIAMHIAGSGKRSYAIPAYVLFTSLTFSPPIELVPPQ